MSSLNKIATSGKGGVSFRLGLIAMIHGALGVFAAASSVEVVVSVPEQKLYVFDAAGEKVASYRVSTADKFGDQRGTYATPLGKLEVANKIGGGAEIGTVFKGKFRTGEIVPINAKGRDPIVTRILHLRGTEAQNAQAYSRCIYIHGTPDEKHLGRPVSYGCIRMASADVVQLFDMVDVGSTVEITKERVTSVFGGIVRRPVPMQAVASASSATPPTAAVSSKLAANQTTTAHATRPGRATLPSVASGPMFPNQTRSTDSPAKRASDKREGGSHVKLLETSGLTINFGGGSDSSDRPR